MKNTFFLFSIFLTLTFISKAQLTINVAGTSTDIAGSFYSVNIDPTSPSIINSGELAIDLELHNVSGSSKSWRITRKKIMVPSDWNDKLCIPGNCYETNSDTWTTPAGNPVVLQNGALALIKIDFTPNQLTNASTIYKYYIGDGTTYEDSVEIRVNFSTLALKTVKPGITFSMSPNPANEFVSISTNSNENTTVKIIDVLGSTVYNETLSSNKKVDVSDLKNGIYFVTIESSDSKITNRKLIVRH